MRQVTVQWAGGKFTQDITVGRHIIRADEEADQGGDDTGPVPHELLLAALGACTAMTLKVYAERKGWPLRNVRVTVNGATGATGFVITVRWPSRARSMPSSSSGCSRSPTSAPSTRRCPGRLLSTPPR